MKKYIFLMLLVLCVSTLAYAEYYRSIHYNIRGFNISVKYNKSGTSVILSKNLKYQSEWKWDGDNLGLVVFDRGEEGLGRKAINCLNAYKPKKGSNVNIYTCNKNDPEQHWEWENHSIRLVGTNLCLNSYKTHEGSNLNLYPCDSSDPDQKFTTLKNISGID